jgi:hypothetical protein
LEEGLRDKAREFGAKSFAQVDVPL